MKEQLHEISQKSQAETIDLWPEIYAELKETKTMKAPRMSHQLARIAAVISLFFLGGLVVYAISQIYVDSGLEGERAEHLVTPINLSVTQGDVTIVVDWAYADMNRVTLAYRVLDAEGNTYIPEGGGHQFEYEVKIANVTNDPLEMRYITGFVSPRAYTFYRGDKEQEIVNFNPAFNPAYIEIPESLSEEMRIDFIVFWEEDIRPIFITFNLEVSPLQFEVYNVTMESNSIPSVIHEFGVSPTHTTLSTCLDVPEEYERDRYMNWESDWIAKGLKIYFDDVDIASLYPDVTGRYSIGLGQVGDNNLLMRCTLLLLDIPLDTMPQTARIVFDEWLEDRSSNFDTLEEAETMAAIFEEHGYSLNAGNIDHDDFYEASWLSVDSFWLMPPFERQTAYESILNDYFATNPDAYRIEGPWEIEFQVSEPIN